MNEDVPAFHYEARRPSHERDRAIINEQKETIRIMQGHINMLRVQLEESCQLLVELRSRVGV